MKKTLNIILGLSLSLAPLVSVEAASTSVGTVSASLKAEPIANFSLAPKAKAKKDSVAIMREKAEKGDAVAQNQLGVWYYTGKNVKQDYKVALEWWAKSAKQDNPDGIGNMAMCYQLGNGTKKDSVMAMTLYKAAIKKGNASIIPQHEKIVKKSGSVFSARLLMDCYQKGIGVKKDLKKVEVYQEVIAKAGDVDAQFSLALKYLNSKRSEQAAKYFAMAAKKGKKEAVYYQGFLIFNGMGVEQDKANGLALMAKAADQNMPAAQYQVGRAYYEGDGVAKDIAKAQKYLTAAAGKNKNAAWLLGLSYLNAKTPNLYLATQWISEAAKGHEKDINALLADSKQKMFYDYLAGLKKYYQDKDFEAAIKLFKNVEKLGSAEGITMQATSMAHKENKKRNTKKAVSLYQKAIDKGSVAAAYYLSSMYETGEGVKAADKEQALKLLKQAANGGVAYAQDKLGDKFFVGDGVAKDYSEAAKLYLQAEAQNRLTPSAAKNLAYCYERGFKVLPDLADAKKRIEVLKKYKPSNSLMGLLNSLQE